MIRALGALSLIVAAASACTAERRVARLESATLARELGGEPASAADWSRLVPWGTGEREVGLRPTRTDYPGHGVTSVAAVGHGALLLDPILARVSWVDEKGARGVVEVPADARDLAAGPAHERTFLVYSELRSRAWIFEGRTPSGELAIDRSLREIVGLRLLEGRRVLAVDALQNTVPLGSPAAPSTLAASLHGKRKGAHLLPDGSGVAVRRSGDGRAELLVYRNEGRASIARRHALRERVWSARLVGVAGDIACVRLETAESVEPLVIARRVVCDDLRTGARVLDRALGKPGIYLPRRELVVGDAPPRLVFIAPEAKGLRVHSWSLSREVAP